MSNILVTGGSGYLGSILAKILSAKFDVYASYLNSQAPSFGVPLQFDICDPHQVAHAFATARPDCVVHAAALTKPDYCETRPKETHAVNVAGTKNIVGACHAAGAK